MAMPPPSSTSAYRIDFNAGSFDGLKIHESEPLPALGPHDVLVAIEAVSLNYRDIAMPLKLYPSTTKPNVVPCSDAAGRVLAVGDQVSSIKTRDRVCPTFFQKFEDGYPTKESRASSLGGMNDGVLRKHGVFNQNGLIRIPDYLQATEAATLPCAALTAWNALFGLEGRACKAGDFVLTQGTGGVSLFAVQFAAAVGATVISTTSDNVKAQKLRDLGAKHVINYREDAHWGITARQYIESQGGPGAAHILEVGGEATMAQSFKAIASEGVISMIGFLGGNAEKRQASFWDTFASACIVRGINVGSRKQFRDMLAFTEEKRIKPVVDEQQFKFEDAKKAYEYLQAQKFFGKVVIAVE
jgi:NADPH:quinone reductase-like Zn-dependent oxidoreductase